MFKSVVTISLAIALVVEPSLGAMLNQEESMESAARHMASEKPEAVDNCFMDLECMKLNMWRNLHKVMRHRSFSLLPGVILEQEPGMEDYNNGRSLSDSELEASLPVEESQRSEKLTNLLGDSISRLMASRSLKISLQSFIPGLSLRVSRSKENNNAIQIEMESEGGDARDLSEGRKKGLKKILPLLLLFKYKAAMMAALFLAGIAGLAGKALLVSKLSLLLSSVIGLKKLWDRGTTYEIVSQPYYTHEQSYGGHQSSGYGHRSFQEPNSAFPVDYDPLNLAYRGYYGHTERQ